MPKKGTFKSRNLVGLATLSRAEFVSDGFMQIVDVARFFYGDIDSEKERSTAVRAIYRMMDRGELAWLKVGKKRVISRRSVLGYAAANLHTITV